MVTAQLVSWSAGLMLDVWVQLPTEHSADNNLLLTFHSMCSITLAFTPLHHATLSLCDKVLFITAAWCKLCMMLCMHCMAFEVAVGLSQPIVLNSLLLTVSSVTLSWLCQQRCPTTGSGTWTLDTDWLFRSMPDQCRAH